VMSEMDAPSDAQEDDEERDIPIGEEVHVYDERMDEVLRRVVAGVLTD